MPLYTYEETVAIMIVNAIDILRNGQFWVGWIVYALYYLGTMYFTGVLRGGMSGGDFKAPGLIGQLALAAALTSLIITLTPLFLGLEPWMSLQAVAVFTRADFILMAAICGLFTISMMTMDGFGVFSGMLAFFQACAVFAMATAVLSEDHANLVPGWSAGATIAVAGAIATLIPGFGIRTVAGGRRSAIAVCLGKSTSAFLAVIPMTLYAGWVRFANGL
jgi:hypothetical protein